MQKISSTIILITFFLSAINLTGNGQIKNIRVKSYSIKDGLSNSNVRSIIQDKDGYIWVATVDGLNKFDGYEFTHYTYNERDLNSLPTNDIRSLFADSHGNFWIGTTKGLSKYNFETDDFSNYLIEDSTSFGMFDINYIQEDIDGTLWLSTNMQGVVIYNPSTQNTIRLKSNPNDPSSISSNNVQSIFIDSKRNIWVTTIDKGINLYNRNSKSFRHFEHDPKNSCSLAGNDVHSMTEDMDGNIWVACHYVGLSKIAVSDIEEGCFKNYYSDPANKNGNSMSSARIVCADKKGGIWIGKEDGKMDYYLNGTFNHYDFREFPTATLIENQTNSIYQDINNDIWVGSYFGGVYMIHKINHAFETFTLTTNQQHELNNNKVWEFAEDNDGLIWIATDDGGLKSFNPSTKKFTGYTTLNSNINTNKVLCVYIDKQNRIWIGTWRGGFSRFFPDKGVFKAYTIENSDLQNNNIFDITEDLKGNLWLATQNGLARFNPQNETFKTYTSENSGLIFNQMEVIKTDSFGNLLIGNVMGFEIFNPETEQFTTYVNNPSDDYSISNNYVTSIFEENKSAIWLTTRNGLNKLDRTTGKFTRYMAEDGLPSNYTLGIEKDSKGCFWISTNFGISELDPAKNIIRNYTTDDGLQDYLFIKKSHFKSRDGQLYFGGIKGFNIISIWNLESTIKNTPLVFTEFLISNKPVKPNDDSKILTKQINLTRQIILTHEHPTFSVRYSALSYLNPENSRYAYKLEGFDKEWNYVGNQRQATYTNLDPGSYVLKVLNITNTNVDENKAISLEIKILPPWWNTLVFKIALGLLLLITVLTIYFRRVGRLQKQKQMLEEEVQKRTLDLTEANQKLIVQQEELFDANIKLEENQDEIMAQNDELENHRNHLEQLVSERTSELEQAMKKAEESDKLKSAFLANLSHEIRTPMNAIVGFASLLDNEDINRKDRKNYIDTINSNCDMLTVLINDIIDISLIESNQVKINKSPFHTNSILEELLNIYQFRKKEDIDLVFDNLNSSIPLIINNDPIRFRQVFSNLIANALKYTEKGTVNFGYQIGKNEVKFYVTDTGIGISKEDFKTIFDQFHKIENRANKLYRGVGIGLSICKSLVEMMDGSIGLESIVDVGSTFYFTLPYTDTIISEKKEPETKSKINRPNLTGVRILIAENEPDNYLLLQKIIVPTHADIIWAKNGLDALEKVQSMENYNSLVVLMDIKMPVMDGVEATQKIHAINSKIPIIAVTAYANENDKLVILQNKFDGYITKPIRINELFKVISECLIKISN